MPAVVQMTPEQLGVWFAGLQQMSFAEPLKVCAVAVAAGIKDNFSGSHSPDGLPWLPLARPRRRGPGKPLWDFGILMASTTARGAQGNISIIDRHSLVYGTNVHYASYHQYGTRYIPARPFVGVSAKTMTTIIRILAEFVARQVAAKR